MMETTIKAKKPTALEKLYADKLNCKHKSQEVQQRLNENFSYIQNNAGRIAFSSVTSLMFPGKKSEAPNNQTLNVDALPVLALNGLGISDYISIGRNMLPHIWAIAKPVLVTWGISKTQSFIFGKLFGRKKKK